ncbi:dTDP-4-dehydrorhamnose 3,5-epimerase [Algoriphagus marinus]|uniref:dTDP-4-dehydrorhamnose 3,5-epimerase n=1 Tax=Algoriphagus marinus TaxID=1925762 RepID=UPI00094B9FA4|nr:dTDP-4-dehydrorhamnose 3,5-epimerase [Algoriphagus marinus]
MKFIRTEISDVVLIEPSRIGDDRGYFSETFRADTLKEFLGFQVNFCQDNESKSGFGVLRGLHFQVPPFAQTKLVKVIQGKVLDVAVDIRKGSPTFGKHVAVELSSENRLQMFVPKGFAHGFVVLSETAIFNYKVDNYYNQPSDRGIAFDDPSIGIDWVLKFEDLKLSRKDQKQHLLKEADLFDFNIDLYA